MTPPHRSSASSFRDMRHKHDLEHPTEPKHLLGEPTRIPTSDRMVMAAVAAGRGDERTECGTDRLSLDAVVGAETNGTISGEEGAEEEWEEEDAPQAAAALQNDFSASASVMTHNTQNIFAQEEDTPSRVLKSSSSGAGVEKVAIALGAGNAPMPGRRETHASGHASPVTTASTRSSTGEGDTNSGHARQKEHVMPRRLTMTWEAFLAQHTEEGDEEEEEEEGEEDDGGMSARMRIRPARTPRVSSRFHPVHANTVFTVICCNYCNYTCTVCRHSPPYHNSAMYDM